MANASVRKDTKPPPDQSIGKVAKSLHRLMSEEDTYRTQAQMDNNEIGAPCRIRGKLCDVIAEAAHDPERSIVDWTVAGAPRREQENRNQLCVPAQ